VDLEKGPLTKMLRGGGKKRRKKSNQKLEGKKKNAHRVLTAEKEKPYWLGMRRPQIVYEEDRHNPKKKKKNHKKKKKQPTKRHQNTHTNHENPKQPHKKGGMPGSVTQIEKRKEKKDLILVQSIQGVAGSQ